MNSDSKSFVELVIYRSFGRRYSIKKCADNSRKIDKKLLKMSQVVGQQRNWNETPLSLFSCILTVCDPA